MLRFVVVAAALAAVACSAALVRAEFDDCAAPGSPIVVGQVACEMLSSAFLGATTPVSYYVPPGCTAETPCPVLYLLHGFGGDYRSMLGVTVEPSSWVRSLDSGPPVDPDQVPDPWNYSNPDDPVHPWIPLDPIRFILIAPHGQTLTGGYGPQPGLDSFWTDWNPRYALGGDAQRYETPPPRFEAFLIEELIPFVEANFPALPGRERRALSGTSLGGYGSFKNGLQHPDLWTSIGSVSGAFNFLFAPAPDPIHATSPVQVSAGPLPYTRLPSAAQQVPLLPGVEGYEAALIALGDPVADQAYFRGNMPRDLAMNARASAGGVPSFYSRALVNDMIPRRPQDAGGTPFEVIVFPMNLDMELAFIVESVPDEEHEFYVHPGNHSEPYRAPYLRALLWAQYTRVLHPPDAQGGIGDPPPLPARFDYRSIANEFEIWGWRFEVEREPIEFLNLRNVSCQGLDLQGTGVVTVTVPASCRTGFDGQNPFTVDLGADSMIDEPAGASAVPAYGQAAHRTLTRLP